MSLLQELGQHVGVTLDATLRNGSASESARRSFIRSLRRRSNRSRNVLLAAAVVGCVGIVIGFVRNHPITVTIGGAKPSVGLGALVSAPADREVPLSFSDGSVVALAPGGEASIASLDRDGGTLGIRRGLAHAHIMHNEKTHWAIQAGPYRVAVTGTRFDIEWQPNTSRLFVNLFQGSVVVTGQARNGSTTLVEGQQLLIANGAWTVRNATDTQVSEVLEIAPAAPLEKASEREAEPNSPRTPVAPSTPQHAVPAANGSWVSLASGRLLEALSQAGEREGARAEAVQPDLPTHSRCCRHP